MAIVDAIGRYTYCHLDAYWRAVINEYTGGRYEERWLDGEGFRGWVQLFGG